MKNRDHDERGQVGLDWKCGNLPVEDIQIAYLENLFYGDDTQRGMNTRYQPGDQVIINPKGAKGGRMRPQLIGLSAMVLRAYVTISKGYRTPMYRVLFSTGKVYSLGCHDIRPAKEAT
jgi:hypothetical protein